MSEFILGRKQRSYAKFTPAAAEIIREVYPSGGVAGTLVALEDHGLPGHSSASIRKWASENGVKFLGAKQ